MVDLARIQTQIIVDKPIAKSNHRNQLPGKTGGDDFRFAKNQKNILIIFRPSQTTLCNDMAADVQATLDGQMKISFRRSPNQITPKKLVPGIFTEALQDLKVTLQLTQAGPDNLSFNHRRCLLADGVSDSGPPSQREVLNPSSAASRELHIQSASRDPVQKGACRYGRPRRPAGAWPY